MARKRRDTGAGLFHVFTHCVWAADRLYRDDEDRTTFLRELARANAKANWRCLSYCLMGTHYHLILDVDSDALPRGMHALNFRYAAGFNKRYGMRGHVLGTRYNAFRVSGTVDLLSRFKYVAVNPVEAGLCESPLDWRWSSYGETVGLRPASTLIDDSLVLGCFDGLPELARGALRRFVEGS